jgi:hypothetical protein
MVFGKNDFNHRPLDAKLAEMLKAWKEERGGRLAIGTSEDTSNEKLLPLLKRLAKKADCNCGHCAGYLSAPQAPPHFRPRGSPHTRRAA